ncbi:uncharacterized protein LOC132062214 [Lycium ferocissimum]|uniref:uncharacterized protein LOC132062214 n=1 Tax=Lycium ferocissimum TaxID=112874 RepID=UPI002814C5E1|nr:uncharacterized protein LOC132062214 [Lycium ferocissimum]
MGDKILLAVDLHGEWIETDERYSWKSKGGLTVPILVRRDITYDEFVDIVITRSDVDKDGRRWPILRVNVVEIGPIEVPESGEAIGVFPGLASNTIGQEEAGNFSGFDYNTARVEATSEFSDFDYNTAGVEGAEEDTNSSINLSSTQGVEGSTQCSHSREDGTGFFSGLTFKKKQELKILLNLADVKNNFSFEQVKNTKKIYNVKCVDKNCKWRLRAMKFEGTDRFRITTYHNMHICGVQHLTSHHRHATAEVVAKHIENKFIEGNSLSTREIKETIRVELGCKISYWKCLEGSYIAKSLTRGTPEHGYEVIDKYRHMIHVTNEGSKTDLKVDSSGRFLYFFVSYGAWINGFAYTRKVLAVDGTHLFGKYGGVLLSAVALDTENHIFPLAFCVVNSEGDASYQYFFEQLLEIVPNTNELCIISDRHPSIKKAVSKIYTEAHYGACMRHLGESIRKNFHCGDWMHHFYDAAKAYRRDEFNDHFQQIKDLDMSVAKYLEDVGFHRWSRAHFPGNRYDVMTTNIAESINSMFLAEREFPITALFNSINRRFAQKFHERRMVLANTSTICVPSVERKIRENVTIGNTLLAHQISFHTFSIIGHGSVAMVDLNNRTCSCREFDLDKIPCPHAIAAIRTQFGDDYGLRVYDFVSPYYSVWSYKHAYEKSIHPVLSEEFWELPPELLESKIPCPYVVRKPGRKKRKRAPSVLERGSKKKKNKCSICKRVGHKRTTCSLRERQNEGTSSSVAS